MTAIEKAWSVLKRGFGTLDLILREEGEEAAIAWLADRGVTREDALRMIREPGNSDNDG
tara:strand:- start:1591 stop:1767 length:177 start_codon:yes stop_codon:yes gene_type:complete